MGVPPRGDLPQQQQADGGALGDVRTLAAAGNLVVPGALVPEDLLGHWADSLGNAVLVFSTDAYEVKMMATLSQPPKRDVHLKLRPVPGGGWVCGNAWLDLTWSTKTQLHWLTTDGRISVWVRPMAEEVKPAAPPEQDKPGGDQAAPSGDASPGKTAPQEGAP